MQENETSELERLRLEVAGLRSDLSKPRLGFAGMFGIIFLLLLIAWWASIRFS
jgi:hypothetical protein